MKLEYTVSFPVVSSLVEGIYYNQNTRQITFDLNDSIYRYEDVSLEEAEKIAKSKSVGSAYSQFKKNRSIGKGGQYLGHYTEIDWEKVDASNFASQNVGISLSGNTWSSAIAPKYSLVADVAPKKNFKVGFTIDGGSLKHHNVKAESVDAALVEFKGLASVFGAKVVVKEVTIYFD